MTNNAIPKEAAFIITGASTGIGKALALLAAKKYSAKILLNARTAEDLENTALEVRQLGGKAVTVAGNVADRAVVDTIVETATREFGAVDVLVNNAGFARPGKMTNLSVQDWRDVFEVNVFAPIELTYKLLPSFLERKVGKIVNVASVAGKIAFPGSVCYAASKFALTGFSEGMAAELGNQGLDVITVCPGLVRTEFFRKNKNNKDITAMAQEPNLSGWFIKTFISISSEEAAEDILKACEKGGSHEIVLTGPGVFLERLAGICPPAAFQLARLIPADRGPKPEGAA